MSASISPMAGLRRMAVLSAILLHVPLAATAGEIHPIVETSSGFLLGASSDNKWLEDDEAARSVKGDESYHLYSLGKRLGEVKGAKPQAEGAPFEGIMGVKLSPAPEGGVIAIAAGWNALPRPVKITSPTQPVYIQAIHDFLVKRGIRDPEVRISQVLRTDLDGDGEEEVLISGTHYFTKDGSVPGKSPAGSYSFVLMRQVVAGKVRTKLIAGEFHPRAHAGADGSHDAPSRYDIAAVLDLKGDGRMQVVVTSAYYEGGGTTVFDCLGEKPAAVLSIGGGA